MKSRGNIGGLIVKNITIKTSTYIFYRRVFTMARFTLPRDLYHGKGALEALKTFKGKKGNDLCWRRLYEAVRIS